MVIIRALIWFRFMLCNMRKCLCVFTEHLNDVASLHHMIVVIRRQDQREWISSITGSVYKLFSIINSWRQNNNNNRNSVSGYMRTGSKFKWTRSRESHRIFVHNWVGIKNESLQIWADMKNWNDLQTRGRQFCIVLENRKATFFAGELRKTRVNDSR